MFERMQMDPNLNVTLTTPTPTTTTIKVDIESVWRTNKTIPNQIVCPLNNSELACDLYEACMANYSSFFHELQHKHDHEANTNQSNNYYYGWRWRTSNNKLKDLEFVIGLFVGILLGATLMYVSAIVAKFCQSSVKRHGRASRQRQPEINQPCGGSYLDVDRRSTIETTYPPDRPRRRRRAPLPPLNTSTQPSFLASLFQRRRRYTTNLVRRLSQSRLFLARQNSSATSGDTNRRYRELDTQRLIDVNAESQFNSTFSITGQRLAMPSAPSEVNLTERIDSRRNEEYLEVNEVVERAETPPPAYVDVIVQ